MKIIVSVLGNLGASVKNNDIMHVDTNELFKNNPEKWAKDFKEKIDWFLSKDNLKYRILFIDSYIETLELLRKFEYKFLSLGPSSDGKRVWLETMIENSIDLNSKLTPSEVEFLYNEAMNFEYINRQLIAIPSITDIEWVIRNMIMNDGQLARHHVFGWVVYK